MIAFEIKITAEHKSRLEHHARRLGMTMVSIVRDCLIERLDLLDEKEIDMRMKRANRSLVPAVVQHRWGEVPGLGKKKTGPKAAMDAAKTGVPKKFHGSLRRWAEYIEAAKDQDDGKQRVGEVITEIRDRAASEEDVEVCSKQLTELLAERSETRRAVKKVTASPDASIAGDIDVDD